MGNNIIEAKNKFRVGTHSGALRYGSEHQGFILNYQAEKIDIKNLIKNYLKYNSDHKTLVEEIRKSRYQDARKIKNEEVNNIAKILHYQYEFSFHTALLIKKEFKSIIAYLKLHLNHEKEGMILIKKLVEEIKSDLKEEIKLLNADSAVAHENTTVKGSLSSRNPLHFNVVGLNLERVLDIFGVKRSERFERHLDKIAHKKKVSNTEDIKFLKESINALENIYKVNRNSLLLLRKTIVEINSEDDILKKNLNSELLKKYIPDKDARDYLEINKEARKSFIDILHSEQINTTQLINFFTKEILPIVKQQKLAKELKLAA